MPTDPDPDPVPGETQGDTPPVQDTDAESGDNSASMAETMLRSKNIKEFKSTLTCAGLMTFPNGVAVESGINVMFLNKGLYDGKWIIQKETLHIAESRFVAEIEFRKCLDPASKKAVINYVQDNPSDATQDPNVPVT